MGFFRDIARDARMPVVTASRSGALMQEEVTASSEAVIGRGPIQESATSMRPSKAAHAQSLATKRFSKNALSGIAPEKHAEMPATPEEATMSPPRPSLDIEPFMPRHTGKTVAEAVPGLPVPANIGVTEPLPPGVSVPAAGTSEADAAQRSWKTTFVVSAEEDADGRVAVARSENTPASNATSSDEAIDVAQLLPAEERKLPDGQASGNAPHWNNDFAQLVQMADSLPVDSVAAGAQAEQLGETSEQVQVIHTPEATLRVRSVTRTTQVERPSENKAEPMMATVRQADKWLAEQKPASASLRQERASHSTQEPRVQIGRIDVVIEAPAQQKTEAKAEPQGSNGFASRNYLRRV